VRNLGIGRNVLAARLGLLVEHRLLERVRYRTDPDWYEYRLTDASLDLFPAILTLKAWSERHLLERGGVTLDIRHRSCGAELRPLVVCENCREPISVNEADFDRTPPE
jgi:DNA-binding HxlR family transcriptional regulator